jgi:hypothetical protein
VLAPHSHVLRIPVCLAVSSVNPERDKVKAQLKDLEAVFAAEESGGSASVSSKASLWKMREQAALASGEKTVRHHLFIIRLAYFHFHSIFGCNVP